MTHLELYYYIRYILGGYTRLNAPNYLQESNFTTLQTALKAKKLSMVHGTLLEAISKVGWRVWRSIACVVMAGCQ